MDSTATIDKLRDLIKTHFVNLNKMINTYKKSINIIVVGGYNEAGIFNNTAILNEDDIETWNNPKQCKYSDMVQFKTKLKNKGYEISIIAVDQAYPSEIFQTDIDIPHYKEVFKLNNKQSTTNRLFLKDNAINIVLSFCPINLNNLEQVQEYDIRYIICGCMWKNSFPTDIINNILDYDLKSVTKPYNVESYLYMIEIIKLLNKKHIYDTMKSYIYPIFLILGNPISIGFQGNNHKGNSEMIEVIKELQLKSEDFNKTFQSSDFNDFINENKKWNYLNINIKNSFCKLVYGIDECKEELLL